MKIIKTILIAGLLLVAFSFLASPPMDEEQGVAGNAADNYPENGIYSEAVSNMILTTDDMGDDWTCSERNASSTEPNWTTSDGNGFLKQYQPGHVATVSLYLLKYDTVENATLAYDNMTDAFSHYSNADGFGVGNNSMSLEMSGLSYNYFLYFQTGNVVMKMIASTTGSDAIMDMDEKDFQDIAGAQFSKIVASIDG